ncbi:MULTISPECIES: hypothetical protein [Streptosporangium]
MTPIQVVATPVYGTSVIGVPVLGASMGIGSSMGIGAMGICTPVKIC